MTTRVLVFGSFSPPAIPCGITNSVKSLLASRVTETYRLELISTFRDSGASRSIAGRLSYGMYLGMMAATRIVQKRADLVDIHTASGKDFLKHSVILIAAKLVGRPVILRIHGGDFMGSFNRYGHFGKWFIRIILRRSDRVVVLSDGWRRVLETIEPKSRVKVIPNSIDCSHFRKLSYEHRSDALGILLMGNICKQKGHFDLLEAAAILVNKYPQIKIFFAGTDRDAGASAALSNRAAELGISRMIHFLGPIFGKERDQIFTESAIFVLPSHAENMPLSVMEAMAVGLPVVATNVGAIPEMIEDGITGRLVPPGNPARLAEAIAVLLEDTKFRRALGKRAQQMASQSWDKDVIATRTLSQYAELLNGRPA